MTGQPYRNELYIQSLHHQMTSLLTAHTALEVLSCILATVLAAEQAVFDRPF